MPALISPVHPGEVILEDFLKPIDMSVNKLAKALAVDAARLNEVVRGRRGITADTALRLSRYFGTTPEFWMNLQSKYELETAKRAKLKQIEKTITPRTENAA